MVGGTAPRGPCGIGALGSEAEARGGTVARHWRRGQHGRGEERDERRHRQLSQMARGPAPGSPKRMSSRLLRQYGDQRRIRLGGVLSLTSFRMRVALAQINPTVGDIDGNARLIAEWIGRARDGGRRAGRLPRALPPRLSGRGPLPQAPLPRGQRDARSRSWPARSRGSPRWSASPSRRRGADARRSATPTTRSPCSRDGEVAAVYRKNRLPNYARLRRAAATSSPAPSRRLIEVDGRRVGLTICEDIWEPGPPASDEAAAGAQPDRQPVRLALPPRQGRASARRWSPSAPAPTAPLRLLQPRRRPGRARLRRPELRRRRRRRARRPRRPVRGGAAASATSPRRARARAGWPSRSTDLEPRSTRRSCSACATTSRKNGFSASCIGLSGGIDSALVALIAADALGAERVTLRGHAVPALERRDPGRRPRDRRQPRRRADRDPDRRRAMERLRRATPRRASARRRPSAGARRPRTSRRGSAATC